MKVQKNIQSTWSLCKSGYDSKHLLVALHWVVSSIWNTLYIWFIYITDMNKDINW